ncbi:hypothetical protein M422DRAFT_258434 [Sphaerobolus stellatus SS14]|uniref:Uncharacterized protein n=1 Tax=Sphaerobolus stellatus (strain SS14) TaxID=990650 RepID=A0A0C9VM89_SPHS4|nr:hypothetical protein M422DRAFT_258434 [Sphaerobolus stellatus SS14]
MPYNANTLPQRIPPPIFSNDEKADSDAKGLAQLPTWQRATEFVSKTVEKLSEVLAFDDDGEIVTSVESARKITERYLDALWSLVPDSKGLPKNSPIPWTEIRRQRDNLAHFVEPARLPSENFIFERPKEMPRKDLWAFMLHIVKGEEGKLPETEVFRWTRQTDGNFQLATKPRKQNRRSAKSGVKRPKLSTVSKRASSVGGETLDLDVSSSGESDGEEVEEKSGFVSIGTICLAGFRRPTHPMCAHLWLPTQLPINNDFCYLSLCHSPSYRLAH